VRRVSGAVVYQHRSRAPDTAVSTGIAESESTIADLDIAMTARLAYSDQHGATARWCRAAGDVTSFERQRRDSLNELHDSCLTVLLRASRSGRCEDSDCRAGRRPSERRGASWLHDSFVPAN